MQWKDMLDNTNTSTNKQFQDLNLKIRSEVAGLIKTSGELETVINRVISERARFPHINDQELESRKRFLQELKADIQKINAALNNQRTLGKMERDKYDELMKSKQGNQQDSRAAAAAAAAKQDPSAYTQFYQQQQQEILEEQDTTLDAISIGIGNLQNVGNVIKDELKSQNKMLDEVQDDLDVTSGQMESVLGRLDKLLKTDNRCQTYTILFLCGVLLIMILIVGLA